MTVVYTHTYKCIIENPLLFTAKSSTRISVGALPPVTSYKTSAKIMTNVLKWKNVAQVAVLFGIFVFICGVTVFAGIDTASEVYKPDVVEDDTAIYQHLQPAMSIDYRDDENLAGNDRPHRANKWRRDSSRGISMDHLKLIIDNGNDNQIDHEKREKVKEVN